MPGVPGGVGRLSPAWSLAVPSWDVWVWRDVKSVIISDPTFLLINREKISGEGNCSSCIALSGLLVFLGLAFFVLCVYCVERIIEASGAKFQGSTEAKFSA